MCCRAVYPKGVGGPGLARYLQDANKEVEVWLQVCGACWTPRNCNISGSSQAQLPVTGCGLSQLLQQRYPCASSASDTAHCVNAHVSPHDALTCKSPGTSD